MDTQELDNAVLETHPYLYRNNRGCCRQKYTNSAGKTTTSVIRFGIPEPRGYKEPDDFPKGGDRIGFDMVEITPDMVGRKLPIFTNVEIKGDGDRIKPGQIRYHNFVLSKNGISEIWLGDGRIISEPLPLDWQV